jgi:hypothetical protein
VVVRLQLGFLPLISLLLVLELEEEGQLWEQNGLNGLTGLFVGLVEHGAERLE